MFLASLIKWAINNNGIVIAYVYGPMGHGKTSYALLTAYEVLGDWDKVLFERNKRGIENQWCGGWDLNPRRPTPSGPEPDPFDLARAPPHTSNYFSI